LQPLPPDRAPSESELIERLRSPDGGQVRLALIAQLAGIEQRLAHQGTLLQSAARMSEIQAARLAVRSASAILSRMVVDPGGIGLDREPALHQLFRSPTHDQ
jgi:hypothetical protein